MKLSADTVAAINKYGPSINGLARRRYGISGKALLGKLVAGESSDNMGAVSSAGARGKTQFTAGSRAVAIKKFGIDPWRSTDEAVHAAVLHLKGKINGSKGLEGYNPGDPRYASYILNQKIGGIKGGGAAASAPTGPRFKTVTNTTTKQDLKSALVDALLSGKKTPLNAAAGAVRSGAYDYQSTSSHQVALPGGGGSTGAGGPGYADKVHSRANRINAQHLPYQWGGGHAGKTKVSQAIPLDCSGAVSKVLGINPRVAAQFKNWGRPGHGGRIEVYAKDSHVLLKIDGHFWGTSASNPGGGAGWIPASQISAAYLKGFTVRHV